MRKYFYRAVKDKKELVTGYVEAESPAEAKEKVKLLGFAPAGIYEEEFSKPKQVTNVSKLSARHLKLGEKISFTSELQMLLSSGISPLESLETISRHSPSKNVSLFASDFEDKIKKGQTLSEAMEPYSETLGNIYISLCRTGEESGSLSTTLSYLTSLLKKQDDLKSKYIQMSIYPSVLVIVMIGMFFLFGGFLFPRFIEICNISPDDVPFMAKILIDSVNFIYHYWLVLLLGAGGLSYAIHLSVGFKKFRRGISSFLLSIPKLCDCIRYMVLSHYMSVLHVAYEAGVPIIKSLKLAEDTISNDIIKDQAIEVSQYVDKGENLAEAFYKSKLLPGVLLSMVATGEKTGKLGQMFRDCALGIEKKLDAAINALSKAFEPALLIVIGFGVAYLAIAFMQMYAGALETIM